MNSVVASPSFLSLNLTHSNLLTIEDEDSLTFILPASSQASFSALTSSDATFVDDSSYLTIGTTNSGIITYEEEDSLTLILPAVPETDEASYLTISISDSGIVTMEEEDSLTLTLPSPLPSRRVLTSTKWKSDVSTVEQLPINSQKFFGTCSRSTFAGRAQAVTDNVVIRSIWRPTVGAQISSVRHGF